MKETLSSNKKQNPDSRRACSEPSVWPGCGSWDLLSRQENETMLGMPALGSLLRAGSRGELGVPEREPAGRGLQGANISAMLPRGGGMDLPSAASLTAFNLTVRQCCLETDFLS